MPICTLEELPETAQVREWHRSLIVADEKHGTLYYDASTPQAFCISALLILTQRWNQSRDDSWMWYPEPESMYAHAPGGVWASGEWSPGPALLSAEEIESLPEHLRKGEMARVAEYRAWENERNRYIDWYEGVRRVVEAQDATVRYFYSERNEKITPRVRSVAWNLLMDRADWEYESVKLEPLR